jgi:hypothetical protein
VAPPPKKRCPRRFSIHIDALAADSKGMMADWLTKVHKECGAFVARTISLKNADDRRAFVSDLTLWLTRMDMRGTWHGPLTLRVWQQMADTEFMVTEAERQALRMQLTALRFEPTPNVFS